MAEVRIVAKALDDFGDDWHWVVLHDAEPRGGRAYWASSVDTVRFCSTSLVWPLMSTFTTRSDSGAAGRCQPSPAAQRDVNGYCKLHLRQKHRFASR